MEALLGAVKSSSSYKTRRNEKFKRLQIQTDISFGLVSKFGKVRAQVVVRVYVHDDQ